MLPPSKLDWMRELPLPIVDGLRQVRDRAEVLSWALDRWRLRHRIAGARRSGRPLAFDITLDRRGIGMFAELNWVLYMLSYADAHGARPIVHVKSDRYFDPGEGDADWLGHLFDVSWRTESRAPEVAVRLEVSHLDQLPSFAQSVGRMSLWEAHTLASRYLVPTPAIRAEVARYIRAHLGEAYLALHWRGTDKVLEAPAVTIDEVLRRLLEVAGAQPRPITGLFVASDDRSLVAAVRTRAATALPGVMVVSRHEAGKGGDGQPLHLRAGRSGPERRLMGEDALIDCLLLSHSVALVRTASFLSAWCSIFQPALPVFLLNRPYDDALWFPEREVVHLSAYHAARLARGPSESARRSPKWPTP